MGEGRGWEGCGGGMGCGGGTRVGGGGGGGGTGVGEAGLSFGGISESEWGAHLWAWGHLWGCGQCGGIFWVVCGGVYTGEGSRGGVEASTGGGNFRVVCVG